MTILIISLAVYFLFKNRHNLIYHPNLFDSIIGFLFMLFAYILFYAGKIAGILILSNTSLFVMIIGIILIVIGRKSIKTLSIPLVIILSLFGIFEEFFRFIVYPLQISAAAVSATILNMIGIPTIQDSIYLIMPHITLVVQSGCSGINHLTALIIFSLVLSFSYNKTTFSTLILAIIAPIIGIFLNAIRIVLIAIWAIFFKGEMLHGPGDIFYITFVFIFGLITLIYIASKLPNNKGTIRKSPIEETDNKFRTYSIVFVIIILAAFNLGINKWQVVPIKFNKDFSQFPKNIGEWSDENISEFINEFEIEKADEKLLRLYTTSANDSLELYLGYFSIQEQEKEINNYKQNSILENADTYSVKINESKIITINHSIYYKNNTPWNLFFWYIIDDKNFYSPIKTKIYTVKNGLIYQRTNGAIVVIALKTADKKIKSDQVLKTIIPIILSFFSN
jgi:EpsI family protein